MSDTTMVKQGESNIQCGAAGIFMAWIASGLQTIGAGGGSAGTSAGTECSGVGPGRSSKGGRSAGGGAAAGGRGAGGGMAGGRVG